jgi:hypothetical protein
MKYSVLSLNDALLPGVRYNHLDSQQRKTKNNYGNNFCHIIIIIIIIIIDRAAIV